MPHHREFAYTNHNMQMLSDRSVSCTYNLFVITFFNVILISLQLRLDVAELNQLLSTAERQKVKDILSVEIRKLETEITNLKDLSDKESVTETSVTSVPSSKPKCYEVKLNNYGKDMVYNSRELPDSLFLGQGCTDFPTI